MKKVAQQPEWREFLFAGVMGALLGTGAGTAFSQDRPSGQLDAACAAQCAESGNDGEFCGRVCWVPDPAMAAKSYPVDWDCLTSCRSGSRRVEDCLPVCRLR